MKKKISLVVLAVVILSLAAGLWYARANTMAFDQLSRGGDSSPPAPPEKTFSFAREGDFPGMSDTPVTHEQAAPYRAWMSAMRSTNYLRLPRVFMAPSGGISFTVIEGCMPYCRAYWSGGFMWFPAENGWQPCLPLDKTALERELAKVQ